LTVFDNNTFDMFMLYYIFFENYLKLYIIFYTIENSLFYLSLEESFIISIVNCLNVFKPA